MMNFTAICNFNLIFGLLKRELIGIPLLGKSSVYSRFIWADLIQDSSCQLVTTGVCPIRFSFRLI